MTLDEDERERLQRERNRAYLEYLKEHAVQTRPGSREHAQSQTSVRRHSSRLPVVLALLIIPAFIVAGIVVLEVTGYRIPATYGSYETEAQETLSHDFPIWEDVTSTIARSSVYVYPIDGNTEWKSSGVVFDADGHIVTNYHVVRALDGLEMGVVFASEVAYYVDLIGRDIETDLAVVRINTETLPYLHPAERASASSLQIGQPVAAMGTPRNLPFSLTTGVISGIDKPHYGSFEPEGSDESIGVYFPVIQTDASINPGNSGSGWFDGDGKLIGITTGGKTTDQQGSVGTDFAIPVDLVEKIANRIIEYGFVEHVTLDADLEYGAIEIDRVWQKGAQLSNVSEGGVASSNELADGDIILSIGDKRVTNARQLEAQLKYYFLGECTLITYVHSEEIHEKSLCF
ncbi:MAG: S1C family serine protease [Actinomycetaceae bacterium]|nr:S1C family serine protease [Actinomycetaceae bacterium]